MHFLGIFVKECCHHDDLLKSTVFAPRNSRRTLNERKVLHGRPCKVETTASASSQSNKERFPFEGPAAAAAAAASATMATET